MSPTRQKPRSAAFPDNLQVVRDRLRRSYGILVRRFSGPAPPNHLNRPGTLGWYGIR
jgi:hypothetical protein